MPKKINVLQVVNHLNYGGQEKLLLDILRQSEKKTCSFIFLTIGPPAPYEFEVEIRKLGGVILHLPLFGRYRLGKDQKRELDRIMKDEKIDVIHVHPKADLLAAYASERHIPLVVHSHSTAFLLPHNVVCRLWKKWYFKSVIQPRLANASVRLASSLDAGRFLFGSRNFDVLPNGINVKEYRFNSVSRSALRKNLGIADDCLVILQVGRMAYPKNQSFSVEVLKELVLLQPKVKLIFVGTGPDTDTLKRMVDVYGLKDKVAFADTLDARLFYSAADIMLFPSESEGLGMVAVEAQINRLPVLASDRIPREVQISNNIQFLPLEKGASFWAERLRAASLTKRQSDSMVDEKKYDVRETVMQLESIYERLV